MKKFKLNAVLASVLSLGLICSSSVCASREGEQYPAGLAEEPIVSANQNAEEDSVGSILNKFEEYQAKRGEIMGDTRSVKARIHSKDMAQRRKIRRFVDRHIVPIRKQKALHKKETERRNRQTAHLIRRTVDVPTAYSLSKEMDKVLIPVLRKLSSLRSQWDERAQKIFYDMDWDCLPLDSNDYIEMMRENSYNIFRMLDCTLEYLNAIKNFEPERQMIFVLREVSKDIPFILGVFENMVITENSITINF